MLRSMRFGTVGAAVLTVALALAAAACGGSTKAAVRVNEKDFSIALDMASAKSGEVTFDVKNDGLSEHEFVVLETELAANALPTQGNMVDEEAQGIRKIDEIEEFGAGESRNLTLKLAPGSYVLICNLPGHYSQGMRAGFTVQ